jgi:hypothetical protein
MVKHRKMARMDLANGISVENLSKAYYGERRAQALAGP